MTQKPDICVVIPTRNRAALLGRCLASLGEQALDKARFEVCVVNNGSTDQTVQAVDLVRAHYPDLRLTFIDEPRLGVAYARNTGIEHTVAPLVVQGDDDATVPTDWLEKFIASFAALGPDIGKIGGDVIPVWGAPRPAWMTDAMLPLLTAASGFGTAPRFVDEGLLECNGCYRREALAAAGHFPTTLGRKGNSLLSAEHAVDLVMHVAGWKLYYDPSIVIHHHIHADRMTPAWMRRRYFWQGVSDSAIYAYLRSKGFNINRGVAVDLPLNPAEWAFVNDVNTPPDEAHLNRLRSLGFILAQSGLLPTD
ncbi:MAG: glycosyltransferase [Alphaproteobacteria bacterium]|nr:glycosyltransferase [Alphaproteobacteria bacterium]